MTIPKRALRATMEGSLDEDRLVAQEARRVLTSLRTGPSYIARGDLAQQLSKFELAGFWQVIMDPRFPGPQTLQSLRSLRKILQNQKVDNPEQICHCVLACKFEQTDAGTDEAVEMAIADVLQELCRYDTGSVYLDAFNTVFVTRNTFVASPALCYHFEDVLHHIADCTQFQSSQMQRETLEFLVHQMLHTPISEDEANSRVICLQLVRRLLKKVQASSDLFRIVQDDLCLSLLMTGQAVWEVGDVPLEILYEICCTMEYLWHQFPRDLILQFEAIWTGFYTRALVLLRNNHQNQLELEMILESLVDIFRFSNTLETLFWHYDCHLHRADVAMGLCLELAKCCGIAVSPEGEALTNRERSDSTLSDDNEPVAFAPVVPAHLQEVCAQCLSHMMRCLFRHDQPSPETLLARSQRKRSILLRELHDDELASQTKLLKSKKRLLRKAARIFNEKSKSGIEYLMDAGLVGAPITPDSLAKFLKHGLVVGLNKRAVGEYIGQAGKQKSQLVYEQVDFHKHVLEAYCQLFSFEGQSILDGLRMFLAAFRLPGEAQQIDRILQAFADSCSRVCEEKNTVFSQDPKRASDAAYLLSFSIIMLNTDRHNDNIREDRKMSCGDFIKNNKDYGRDITEKGKEFPDEYLTGIYDSINQEEIRTEGEGAEGAMTVERWKDILRGTPETDSDATARDAEDLTELVLEHVWKTMVSAVGALWEPTIPPKSLRNAVQGARLGMDLSLEILRGVRHLGRVDIFRKMLICICDYSGLLEYSADASERTAAFCNSIESQAAVVVVLKTALEAAEDLDDDCWKKIWAMILELRDLRLISKAKPTVLKETDADFLSPEARADWIVCLEQDDMQYTTRDREKERPSLLGVFGRALFGQTPQSTDDIDVGLTEPSELSSHGKEILVVWDEGAESDVEEDEDNKLEAVDSSENADLTDGAQFEFVLNQEDEEIKNQAVVPVTGLERVEDTRPEKRSLRSRVRDRLHVSNDFVSLVRESRLMEEGALFCLLRSIIGLVAFVGTSTPGTDAFSPQPARIERSPSDVSVSTSSFTAIPWFVPLSPASEAFAEVMICELALKNKDRLKSIWAEVLQDHYLSRLTAVLINPSEESSKIPADPGLEKRVTGLLRLCTFAVQRPDLASDVLSSWKYVLPVNEDQQKVSPLRALDRHFGEALWRIVSQVDSLASLSDEGWEGIVALMTWCAQRGGGLKPIQPEISSGLKEDDPALQCYRCFHLLMNTADLDDKIPLSIVYALRCLIAAGGRRNYSQLSIASLDLLGLFNDKKLKYLAQLQGSPDEYWTSSWRTIVEAVAEAAELSNDTVRIGMLLLLTSYLSQSVRQHALSMLTDMFLQKQERAIPPEQLCGVLSEVCVPLAGRRILRLQIHDPSVVTTDQLMIEFELCIGLIFKPLRHHLKNLIDGGQTNLPSIWRSVLSVIEALLNHDEVEQERMIPNNLKETMNSLANEHLQNAIQFLLTSGVLFMDAKAPGDITAITWESVGRMGVGDVETIKQQHQAVTDNRSADETNY